MSKIYITGHRNPDFDSIAAAHVYAHLKNREDPDNEYIAVRCGNLNAQTRAIFNKLDIEPPQYMKDIRAVVADVVSRDIPRLEAEAPLQTAIGVLDETGRSILPVFTDEGTYQGTISSIEISHFLLKETFGVRPTYHFRINNLTKVVPGTMIVHGKKEEFTAPIMIGAMPFERSLERIEKLETNRPLLIVGLRRDLVDYAISQNFPAVILTGANVEEAKEMDFSKYSGTVYLSDVDTAETVRLLRFSTPIGSVMETKTHRLDVNENYDVAKKILMESEQRGLPVFQNERFAGIVSRGSFLDKPRKKLILVDHNELEQSLPGARDADIVEIIDHHRVGSVMSREPFSIYTRPVGSTCTIIRKLYRQQGIAIPAENALLMLSAILSDTVLLKSPTTTEEDRQTVEGLARHVGVDWREWGETLFATGARIVDIPPKEAVGGDFKIYESNTVRFGIGQVEIQDFSDLETSRPMLEKELTDMRGNKGLDGAMLLVTNVMSEDSVLILQGLENLLPALPYERQPNGVLNLPGILSRKKQLLPEILRAIEECCSMIEK